MGNTTVNGALLLAGLMLFAGSVFSLNADGFGRRVLKPNDVILAQGARVPDVVFRLAGHIDADVLDWDYKKAVMPTLI